MGARFWGDSFLGLRGIVWWEGVVLAFGFVLDCLSLWDCLFWVGV